MQPKKSALVVATSFTSLFVRMAALLSASVILSPLPALAEKIPVFSDGRLNEIFLESASVRYKGKFVYFQTEKFNMFAGYEKPRLMVVNHVMDCETGNWQITRAIGRVFSYTTPDVDLTSEFQGKTFFAEPGTASGILYKTLCR
ncbi:MAG: DUF2163 domain-containing protein [Richelia sp. SL_2_1]|nr:DUF2163 domain-containing protein [Richelia sp. SM2_1_7]NJM21770.1 DUF2163 domain-containing protein [Richelia sp. SM1_7_0]NJN12335.1 DUF2163 domain-containing protein [Richelia sp. RM1_1_1]NJO30701.1 DUF2163 domain-containing protein [Richelia sp. SL_2_1]